MHLDLHQLVAWQLVNVPAGVTVGATQLVHVHAVGAVWLGHILWWTDTVAAARLLFQTNGHAMLGPTYCHNNCCCCCRVCVCSVWRCASNGQHGLEGMHRQHPVWQALQCHLHIRHKWQPQPDVQGQGQLP
jgi:hypothetical protein